MKRRTTLGLILGLATMLSACGSGGESQDNAQEAQAPEEKNEQCTYSYNAENTSLTWTAFKTTDRVAVGGTFTNITVNMPGEYPSAADAVSVIDFEIETASVSTDNPARDETISTHFFASLADEGRISGAVKGVHGNAESGKGTMKIKMNGVARDIDFTYTIMGSNVLLKTAISISDFSGDDAVAALNTVCDGLHKGPDGISKLWPDIDIEVSTKLDKKCD